LGATPDQNDAGDQNNEANSDPGPLLYPDLEPFVVPETCEVGGQRHDQDDCANHDGRNADASGGQCCLPTSLSPD
jgi:hypothetical protein